MAAPDIRERIADAVERLRQARERLAESVADTRRFREAREEILAAIEEAVTTSKTRD